MSSLRDMRVTETEPLVPAVGRLRGVLFDLDGTLIDPRVAITGSLTYAFEQMGLPVPAYETLVRVIGPPLLPTLTGRFGLPEADALALIEHYRVDFGTRGILANVPYAGMGELLAALQGRGLTLAVATSKPTVYALQIIEHLGWAERFAAVVGSNLDHSRTAKAEVIAHVLELLPELREAGVSVMIGDREHDVIGAHANGMAAIGVTYGIGSAAELQAAQPWQVVPDVAALDALLQEVTR